MANLALRMRNQRDDLIMRLDRRTAARIAQDVAEKLVGPDDDLPGKLIAATRDSLDHPRSKSREVLVDHYHKKVKNLLGKSQGEMDFFRLSVADRLCGGDVYVTCKWMMNLENHHRGVEYQDQIDVLLACLLDEQKRKRDALVYKLEAHEARRLAIHFATEFFYNYPTINEHARDLASATLRWSLGQLPRVTMMTAMRRCLEGVTAHGGTAIVNSPYYMAAQIAVAPCYSDRQIHAELVKQLDTLMRPFTGVDKSEVIEWLAYQINFLQYYLRTKELTWKRP